MNVSRVFHNIAFEWDSQKAAENVRKHGVSFDLACEAFFDPFVYYLDDETVSDELRNMIIGMSTTWKLLFVVYVLRRDVIRIVSARLATVEERKSYEDQ
jgi:uncharacterized DUF497 family protein